MKEIKEFNTFSGTDGFIIVDGENQNTPGGKLKIPNYADAAEGAVLTKSSDDIVWQVPQGGGIELPELPTENATGGGLDETTTRIKLVGECNYEDHFTLKWEYE